MNKKDNMIDALLQEHARQGDKDDAGFLADLEKRLDHEESVVDMAQQRSGQSKGSGLGIGLGVAAAVTVAAVGFYGWQQAKEQNNAMVATHEVEAPVATRGTAPGHDRKETFQELDKGLMPGGNSQMKLSSEPADIAPAPESAIVAEVNEPLPKPKPSLKRGVPMHTPMRAPVPVENDSAVRDGFGYSLDLGGGGLRPEPPIQGRAVRGNRYGSLTDNTFKSPWKDPLSTFSVDVDTASYTNVRRMIQNGQAVPANAVRIEEMINYFNYTYPQPEGKHPFSVNVETASCPWNAEHRLVKIGLKGKEIVREKRPAANLVFLLDVSGSMNSQDKLPLLVDSMKILLKELNADDSVSIVVYAGAQGLALPPTYVDDEGRKTILNKLNNFRSGGSTNGGAGITLAYKMAKKHFVKGGVNRVILGTDGDFNVGVTGTDALVSMVEREAKSGVFMSVLGFGQGNLNDNMLEKITNKGNGNYFYIDNLREGRKVFLDDMMGTMVTIAKDVKLQIEFNPAKVKSYRLIGYANRMLKAEDFKNKRIDAGEIGAGHTVTALYEVVPGNATEPAPAVDDLEFQKKKTAPKPADREVVDSPHSLVVKLAYKQPDATKETESSYFRTRVTDSGKDWQQASVDFKFASGVGLFGMLQRKSQYAGQGNYQLVRQLAEAGRGDDPKGLRTEFSDLVRKAAK